jgi:uncharacterized protein YndB with AHSA1/START domain
MKASEPLVKEVVLDAPLPKVWDAIATLDGIRSWFVPADDFKPEVGFVFHANCMTEENPFWTTFIIKEIEPNKKISFYWNTDGYPQDDNKEVVLLELNEENGKTKLTLIHTGFEESTAFVDNKFTRNDINFGWDFYLGKLIGLFNK